jgi:ATP synthase protein I
MSVMQIKPQKKGKTTTKTKSTLSELIDSKAKRKIKKQRSPEASAWFGLGMMGLIGWSVALPTILGAAMGIWLDKHYKIEHSWTLALIIAGLTIGCFTAWGWLSKEYKAMHENDDEKTEKTND